MPFQQNTAHTHTHTLINVLCPYFYFAVGPSYIADSTTMATPTLIAIIVSCVVFTLFVGLLLMFCRCKRNKSKKGAQAKDYEMDSVRPSIVAQQNQAPPPYYPASGLENKALEHSMDLALTLEDQKAAVYATQNGYGYHQQQSLQVPGQHIPNSECKYPHAVSKQKFIYLKQQKFIIF